MLFRHAQRAPHAHLNRLPVRGICDDMPFLCKPSDSASDSSQPSSRSSASHAPTSTPFDPVASKPPATTTTAVHTPTGSASDSASNSSPSASGSASDSGSQSSVSTPAPTSDPISTPVDTPPSTTFTPATGIYTSQPFSSSTMSFPTDTTSSNSTLTDPPTKPANHNTITYIGIAAGVILVLALLFALISFVMKRINKRRENEALGDVFDRNSFVNDSAPVPDGPEENSLPSERGRPRPPTMIDRHIRTANRTPGPEFGNYGATGAAMNNGGYYGQDQYNGQYGQYDDYNNAGYGQGYNQYGQYGAGAGYASSHDGFAPPQGQMAHYDSPGQSPIGDVFTDHIASNPQYINAQVSGPEYPALPAAAAVATADHGRSLTRQPSGKAEVTYPDVSELGRGTSVTPFQAAQYAEIGKRLHNEDGAAAVGGNPSQAYAKLDRQPQHAPNGRPPSAYDSDDAYGGI